ncbi:MAG: peptidoglycan-binding protein [Desulfobulbus sp.]|nr:MAG: peptidoglycan-binding protein [Desulfobulbus sp.]
MGESMNRLCVYLAAAVMLGGCAGGSVNMGSSNSKTVASGAAGGQTTENASDALERCSRPLGTLGINEDHTAGWYTHLFSRYGIQSTVPVLRLLAQESNCFVVVERGAGFRHMTKERRLQQAGELRAQSNFGKGQMVAADYTVSPTLLFRDNDTGGLRGIGSAVGSAFGGLGSLIGGTLAGSVKFGQAQSMLTLVDNRSGIQVAVAEGSASGTSLGGALGLLGTHAGGALGMYNRTPEGKIVVGAMMDPYNNLVRVLRNYKPQEATGPHGMGTGGRLKVN